MCFWCCDAKWISVIPLVLKELGDSGKQSEKAWKILWECDCHLLHTWVPQRWPHHGPVLSSSCFPYLQQWFYRGMDWVNIWILSYSWAKTFYGPFFALKENIQDVFRGLFAHRVDFLAFIKHQASGWMFPLVNFPSQGQSMFLQLKTNFYTARYNQDFVSVLLNYCKVFWIVLYAATPLYTT